MVCLASSLVLSSIVSCSCPSSDDESYIFLLLHWYMNSVVYFTRVLCRTGIGFPQKDVRKSRTQQGDTEELMTGPDEYEVDEATGELKRKTYDDGMNMGKSNSRGKL